MQYKAITERNLPHAFDSGIQKIASRAKDSSAMVPYWEQTAAILGGIKTMRDAKTKYLPKFTKETDADYAFRLQQTKMTNIFRDIVESLVAKPFEQDITLEKDDEKTIPTELDALIENIDGSGNNISVFSKSVFFASIAYAIDWIIIDYPDTTNAAIKTKEDQKKSGVRPYWSRILAINVLEVRSETIAGKEIITYFKFLEPGEPDRIRVFERGEDGKISFKVFIKAKNVKDEWELEKEGFITIDVIPVVPLIVGQREGKTFEVLPPLLDACDLQIDLFQQESALKFIKVLAAYPMLAGNGVKPEKDAKGNAVALSVGPMTVLYAPPGGDGQHGTWSFIEPSASSLVFLKKDISETQQDLRELGKQPLTAQSGNLTTITTAVAAGKSRSAVAAWAAGLKDTLENALVISCKWLNIKDDVYSPTVSVYTDFDNFIDAGTDLDALGTARGNGDISQETYLFELKRRKVLSADFDFEKEKKRILSETAGDDESGLDTLPDPKQPKLPGLPA